mmetsp:Transcript_9550/g.18863  ORF Transcript_9550/g.18863 Transcript_9550/m.18863 type:complete len:327 (-) Transcript_9550:203-1183(-)
MIRSNAADLGELLALLGLCKGSHLGRVVVSDDPRALVLGELREETTQNAGGTVEEGRRRLNTRAKGQRRVLAGNEIFLGEADSLNVLLVGLFGLVTPGKEAVLEQNETVKVISSLLKHLASSTSERKSRDVIGHDGELKLATESLLKELVSLFDGVVSKSNDGIGVTVVHKTGREKSMKKSLDGRVGRRGIEHVRTELVNHLRVAHGIQIEQLAKVSKIHLGKALGDNRIKIVSTSLHAENVDIVANAGLALELDTSVATSMEYQGRLATDEVASVTTNGKVFRSLRETLAVSFGLCFIVLWVSNLADVNRALANFGKATAAATTG